MKRVFTKIGVGVGERKQYSHFAVNLQKFCISYVNNTFVNFTAFFAVILPQFWGGEGLLLFCFVLFYSNFCCYFYNNATSIAVKVLAFVVDIFVTFPLSSPRIVTFIFSVLYLKNKNVTISCAYLSVSHSNFSQKL